MDDILKQRLVGALILLALGVVFWPIIFVEPGQRASMEPGRIPAAPEIDTRPLETPNQDGLQGSPEWVLEPDESSEETVLIADEDIEAAPAETVQPYVDPPAPAPLEEPQTRTSAPEQPVLDSRGVPVAWILQVASVGSVTKANELRDRLLAMNEKAYVKKIETGQRTLYRVYIGPNFEKAQLEKIQGAIDADFRVKSMIVRYLP
ncbi:MAG: SPOR domain-containing protein [Halioglobus sp.]|nr:SPOR domain-containing protein [Halioglobus sp.]